MKKRILTVISLLLALTSFCGAIYLGQRQQVERGSILIKTPSNEISVSLSDLPLTKVEGETVNKKGEVKKISAQGYEVAYIPSLAGADKYTEISVYSDDEYHADISANELLADVNKAWIILEEESPRLIVFGDTDSKRNVKNVVRIEIK